MDRFTADLEAGPFRMTLRATRAEGINTEDVT